MAALAERATSAHTQGQTVPRARAWVWALTLLAAMWLWMGLAYWDTVVSLVNVWNRDETFTHGYVILPLALWLIWRERKRLVSLGPAPSVAGVLIAGGAGALWLAAQFADAVAPAQFAFVALLPLSVWAVCGWHTAWHLRFPLAFMMLMVPFGESWLPALMEFTADFAVTALQLSGIPVFRDGLFFTIPSGNWSVVEACSGLRYLIASLTVGILYAYLTYQSTAKRLVFIALSIVVPILANGIRAYMIVMLGHLSNMKLATGIDHYIYGWVFFGVVMLLLFWLGSRWQDPEPKAPQNVLEAGRSAIALTPIPVVGVLWILVSGVWPFVESKAQQNIEGRAITLQFASATQQGQNATALAMPAADWQPRYAGARSSYSVAESFQNQTFGVHIKYYVNQQFDSKLVTSTNRLTSLDNRAWFVAESRPAAIDGVTESEIRDPNTNRTLLVWHTYWVCGHTTDSAVHAKLLQAWCMLTEQRDDAALIAVSALAGYQPQATRDTLRAFWAANQRGWTQSLGQTYASSLKQGT